MQRQRAKDFSIMIIRQNVNVTQKFFSCENLSIWFVRVAPSFAIINSPCLRKERKLHSCIEVSMIPSAKGLYGGSPLGCSTFPLHHKQPLIWETDKQNAGTGHQHNVQNPPEHFSGETGGRRKMIGDSASLTRVEDCCELNLRYGGSV